MFGRILPASLVRWFARPYVAGGSMEDALDLAAQRFTERGVTSSLDLLGEDVREQSQIDGNVEVYEKLIDTLATDPRFADAKTRPSVSVKPSAFTTAAPEQAAEPLEALARRAHESGLALTLDMEDHRWTDFTIDITLRLFEQGLDVGTVLQTRLHRTEKDLERIPAGMRIRLVIGIYPEAPAIALTKKRPMKERLLAHSRRLLERDVFVEFATHDLEFVERFAREVAPAAPERCEVQMILGVPRAEAHQRLLAGKYGLALPVRIYIPFAVDWDDAIKYLRRRMEESPNVAWLAFRNLFASDAR